MTLEPDGQATACKAVSSGFDSRWRLFGWGAYSSCRAGLPRHRWLMLFGNSMRKQFTAARVKHRTPAVAHGSDHNQIAQMRLQTNWACAVPGQSALWGSGQPAVKMARERDGMVGCRKAACQPFCCFWPLPQVIDCR